MSGLLRLARCADRVHGERKAAIVLSPALFASNIASSFTERLTKMPSLWGQSAIIGLWIFTTVCVYQREGECQTGPDRSPIACLEMDRHRLKRWTISLNGKDIGGLTTTVQTRANGSTQRVLSTAIRLCSIEPTADPSIVCLIRTDLTLKPGGEFDSLKGEFRMRGISDQLLLVNASIRDQALTLTGQGIPLLDQPVSIPVPGKLAASSFVWPIDRIHCLEEGQKWRTQTADLLGDVSNSLPWLAGSVATSDIEHSVVGSRAVYWKESWHDCFVIENRRHGCVYHTIVRKKDGMVLEQQMPIGGNMLTIKLAWLEE